MPERQCPGAPTAARLQDRSARSGSEPWSRLYAARVGDLKPGDFVIVQCGVCGHDGLMHSAALASLGLGPDERVLDIAPRLRCRRCDTKGKAVASIRWGERCGEGGSAVTC
jgi:hypothetical protein